MRYDRITLLGRYKRMLASLNKLSPKDTLYWDIVDTLADMRIMLEKAK